MKYRIKKNKKDIRVYGFALFAVIVVAIAAMTFILYGHWDQLVLCTCWLFLIKLAFNPYLITDNNQLVGMGVVMIPLIRRLERMKKGGVRLYYVRMEGGRVRSRSYYPEDEKYFIDTLTEINPNIQIH